MEEISLMRTQLLNDLKVAKEAQPKKGSEVKESKKSPSPDGKKKTSLKESKKPKSKK